MQKSDNVLLDLNNPIFQEDFSLLKKRIYSAYSTQSASSKKFHGKKFIKIKDFIGN